MKKTTKNKTEDRASAEKSKENKKRKKKTGITREANKKNRD